jgi:hypothetical protein
MLLAAALAPEQESQAVVCDVAQSSAALPVTPLLKSYGILSTTIRHSVVSKAVQRS